MARRTVNVTIEEEGRDKGKTFVLTEMPATVGEKWAMQLMHLMLEAGAPIGEEEIAGGMAALASIPGGIRMARALQDPSLDGWWDCVRYQHAANHPLQAINQGAACQIEEIATITHLRMEVVKLHTDFFPAASPSTTDSHSPARTATGSLPTRTSRPRSAL
jgi:hypothetical protein